MFRELLASAKLKDGFILLKIPERHRMQLRHQLKRFRRLISGSESESELISAVLVDDVAAVSIQLEFPERLGDLQREQQMRAMVNQLLGPKGVEAELRIHGEIEAALLLIHEAPLDPEIS